MSHFSIDLKFLTEDTMSADLPIESNNALIAPIYDKIPLSHLLEAAVQKTYHELYTMADV